MESASRTRKVTFDVESTQVHIMSEWLEASQQARNGSVWSNMAVDRSRFRRQVTEYSASI